MGGKGMAGSRGSFTIGVDLGDRFSQICVVDADGGLSRRHAFAPPRQRSGSGSDRRLRLIYESDRKSDRVDAESLARLGRLDPRLLCPVQHRGAEAQADLALLPPSRRPGDCERSLGPNERRCLCRSREGRLLDCSALTGRTPTCTEAWKHSGLKRVRMEAWSWWIRSIEQGGSQPPLTAAAFSWKCSFPRLKERTPNLVGRALATTHNAGLESRSSSGPDYYPNAAWAPRGAQSSPRGKKCQRPRARGMPLRRRVRRLTYSCVHVNDLHRRRRLPGNA